MPANGSNPLDITSPPAETGLQAAKATPTLSPGGGDVPLPGARLALVLLLSINLFNYIDRYVLAANLDPIEKQLLPPGGADNLERLGNLTFVFMISYMLIAPLFGWLADRAPRWKLVGIGVIIWSLASGASGLAGTFHPFADSGAWYAGMGTFTFLLLTRCFVGIGEAAYGPVAPTVISDLYPVKIRGSVLAWFYAAIPVGSALGYALGGLAGWPWAFYAVVPPGLALGVWCFLMKEPPTGQADLGHAAVRKARLKDYLVLFRTPSYVLNCLGMAAMTFALGGIATWMPYYIKNVGLQPNEKLNNSIFGGIVVVAGLSATLLGGMAGDRLRPRFAGSYFLVSGLAMLLAFPFFLAVLWTPFPWAWVFIFVACFFLMFNTGPSNTILANVTHPAIRAQGFAFNIFFIHLFGDAISPTIIGTIADKFATEGRAASVVSAVGQASSLSNPWQAGWMAQTLTAALNQKDMNAGFLAVSGTILLGGIIWLIAVPFLARDTALAPTRLDAPIPPGEEGTSG
jgi:MFS family permease